MAFGWEVIFSRNKYKEIFDMSSTNKTQNYQLNQWVTTDYVLMSDFNADNRKIDEALSAKANICYGSYVGNGTGGIGSPVQLSFSFAPAVVIVTGPGGYGGEEHSTCVIFVRNNAAAGYTAVCDGTSRSIELACSWNGNALSFNSLSGGANAALEQLNAQGESYYYAAL